MPLHKILLNFIFICFTAILIVENAEGCSCFYTHPQTQFCSSDFVIVIKVKERILVDHETSYKVKINRNFKLLNNSYSDSLYHGHLYTASIDSVCGVYLEIGETYIVSGRIFENKAKLSLCNLVMLWSDVTKRQRKGFKGLYSRGCTCNVNYTTFERKGEALHHGNGRLCAWEGNPGPTDCQEKYGICISSQGRCFWMPSRQYDQCIKEYYQERFVY